ncbi:CFEM domain-containing protein [Colletotrichum tofieldiae]|nr:CFEM domain-containing protein [Colletotrichum tofieldiae]
MIAFVVATVLGKREGFGKDIWTLTVDQITAFIRGFFAFELLYFVTLAVIKASILFLYLRIFGAITEVFRQILWGTHIFNAAVCITFIIVNLNQCKPLSYFWYGWDGKYPGYCIDLSAMTLSHASLNIAIDVWMLVLPATQIYKLNLQKRQKAGIMSMFGVGILRLFPELLYVTNISTSRRGSTKASGNVKIVSQDIATIAIDDVPESSTTTNSGKKGSLGTLTPDRVPLRRLTTTDSVLEIVPSEPAQSLFGGSNRGSKFSDW